MIELFSANTPNGWKIGIMLEEIGYEYKVTKVDLSEKPYKVWVGDETYLTQSIIIATGASAKMLGLDSEKALMGYGVSACATCDGFFFKDKKVFVVGGGDSAMEEATFLTKFANKVTVVHRRDQLRASKIMQDRAENNSKIGFVWNTSIDKIYGNTESGVNGVRMKDTLSGETRDFACEGVFLAIGHTPNTSLLVGQLDTDEKGYIVTLDGSSKTSIEGVFASGDVQDRIYRQAVTAAGSGCMAAIDAERFLESQH